MKLYGKVLSCLLTAAVGMSVTFRPVSALESYNKIEITSPVSSGVYGNFKYSDTYKGIIINSYTGSETDVTIPSQINGLPVYGIAGGAFYGNTVIRSLIIPNSVTIIDPQAFYGCSKLQVIFLSENLKILGKDALTGTAYLNNQKTTVKYAGTGLFDSKSWVVACDETVKSVSIDSSSKHIGGHAFNGCYYLKSIVIPGNIKSIGMMGVANCIELTSVTLCEGIETIGGSAFYHCPKLKSITIPASVTTIDERAFGYTSKDIGDDTDYNVKIAGFTISGYAGTAAETYAKENGFKFINLGSAPNTYTKGDVNQDGKIDISDAIAVLNIYSRCAAGLNVSEYKDVQLKAADVNGNEKVDIQDAISILSYYSQYAAGLNPVL